MKLQILIVDKLVESSHLEQQCWEKRTITTVTANTMQEAIEILGKQNFDFVVINEDTISFLHMLQIMRSVTGIPIFVFTSNFSNVLVDALQKGADAYVPFQKNPDDTVASALALFQKYNEQVNTCKKKSGTIVYNNILASHIYRKVFCNDVEITLTKKEFELLYFLMKHPGRIFTHRQIFRNVWGEEYVDSNENVLACLIRRLRLQLNIESNSKEYIINSRGTGYGFNPN